MRRIITIVLILAMAGFVSWWSARNDGRVISHVQDEVTKLVPLFVLDPASIQKFVLDPILEPILAASLRDVVLESEQQHQKIVVIVTDGDDASFGDGTATHVALLQVDHQPITGLRIICISETDPLLIAGVFSGVTPEAKIP